MKLLAIAGALALACLTIVDPAFAQPTANVTVTAPTWFDAYVLPVIGTIATAIIGWLAALAARLFGLQMEAKHRDALQSALTNAAALVARHGVNFAVDYVMKSVPDAVKKFGLNVGDIKLKVEAKANLQAGAVPSLPVAPAPGP